MTVDPAPGLAPLIGRDRFPVSVREVLDDPADTSRGWRDARVILTVPEPDRGAPGRLIVYLRPGAPVLDIPFRPDDSIIGRKTVPWRIETDGGHWIIESVGGCGCGSRVAPSMWDPFSPMRGVIGAFR